MAVEKVPVNSVLRLELHTGVDTDGNPVFRNKSLNNVKSDASDQDLFDTADALGALQDYPLSSISRIDSAELVEV